MVVKDRRKKWTKNSTLLLTSLVIILFGCGQGSEQKGADLKVSSLDGSWKFTGQNDHTTDPPLWMEAEEGFIHQKHLTSTHFTWLSYNIENDELVGAGGGAYTLEGNTYTEYIEFFHPVGSYLGQAIPFEASVEEGIWYHKGFGMIMEFDAVIGEMVVVDTAVIDEQWARIAGSTEALEMVRTWHLIGYKDSPEAEIYGEYPDFVGYMKLITPSHYVSIRFNHEEQGGNVLGLASGEWAVEGTSYMEHIKVIHPTGSQALNTTANFDVQFEEGRWYHKGWVKSVELSDDGEMTVLDSSMVDEIWIEGE